MRVQFSKWLPALLMMFAIFLLSAQPSNQLPNFDWADRIVKKGSHMMGYAILALSYWRAFDLKNNKRGLAWLLAVVYAVTDEWHQAFVPGRQPSIVDVLIYDQLGALIALALVSLWKTKTTRPPLSDRFCFP